VHAVEHAFDASVDLVGMLETAEDLVDLDVTGPDKEHPCPSRGTAFEQMLAIARALTAPQKLILLDEPFEGLAPAVVSEVLAAVERLRERTSILLVEHKIDLVLNLAERAFVMINGQIAFAGQSAVLQRDTELQHRLLGVGT